MIHYIYPGKFRPVHDGHVQMIRSILGSPDSMVHVIVSAKDTDGLPAAASKEFLDRIFAGEKRYDAVIATAKTPMIDAYDMVCTKAFGDGTYTLVASSKDPDRSGKFASQFVDGAKYHTPGAVVIPMTEVPEAVCYEDGTPVSSSSIRDAIACNDIKSYMRGYSRMIQDGLADEGSITSAYRTYRRLMNRPGMVADIPDAVTEGGAAGHMNHPHEYPDMTFGEVKAFIRDLFGGNITDVKEKLDGMNIFASVSDEGTPIFARNRSEMKSGGKRRSEYAIRKGSGWSDELIDAVESAGATLADLMREIPNGKDFFYFRDGDVEYRTWINAELVCPATMNLIKYSEPFISVHGLMLSKDDGRSFTVTEDSNEQSKMNAITVAAQKTSMKETKLSVQVTPSVSIGAQESVADEFIEDLDEIEESYSLSDDSTMDDFRRARITWFLGRSDRFSKLPSSVRDILLRRWLGEKDRRDLGDIRRIAGDDAYTLVAEFEKTSLSAFLRDVNAPMAKVFMNVGNVAIRAAKGLRNKNYGESAAAIRNTVREMIDSVSRCDDTDLADEMEYMLSRLSDDDLNASEGIVVNYGGRKFKLTGSYATLSRMANRIRRINK